MKGLVVAFSCALFFSASLAATVEPQAAGHDGCWVVKDYWPVKGCKHEGQATVCARGWGAWQSEAICCAPGVAFPEGCGEKMQDCWVVESSAAKTCKRDMRSCDQGYSVFSSQAACCFASFRQNCTDLPVSDVPCWVVDTYWPSRLCTSSNTLCSPAARQAGVQSWDSQATCCAPGSGAFGEGCSKHTPPTPCWMIDSYDPVRTCRKETEVSACNRGWGVYESLEVCCAPNVAFPQGCSSNVKMSDGP